MIDGKQTSKWQYQVFLSAWALYAGYYFCRRNIILPYGSGSSRFALELACFGITYAIGQFVGGALSDDGKAARTALTGAAISMLFTMLQAFVPPSLHWVLQLGNGLGQGLGWPSLLKLLGTWFTKSHRDRVLGWWASSYILGGVLAAALIQWLLLRMAYQPSGHLQSVYLVPPAILGIAALFFTLKMRGVPQIAVPPAAPDRGWRVIFGNRSIRYASGVYFFLKMTRYMLLFWLPHYLIANVGYGAYAASRTASYFDVFGFLGPIAVGYTTALPLARNRMRFAAALLFGLAFICLLHPLLAAGGLPGMVISISLMGILIHGSDLLISGILALHLVPDGQQGRAVGMVNGVGTLGQILSPMLAIFFAARFGSDKLFDLFVFFTLISASICALGARIAVPNPRLPNRSALEPTELPL